MKFALTQNQFLLIMFIIQTGAISISFQTPLIEASKQNAWIVFIVSAIIQFFMLVLYERFFKHFKMNRLVKWLYSFYLLTLVIIVIANIEKSLTVWVFQNTPPVVIIGIIVATSLYANLSKTESVVNLGVLLIPLLPLIFIFLFLAIPDLIWTNLFPMGNISSDEWINGLKKSNSVFIGSEVYLIYRSYVVAPAKILVKTLGKYMLFITSCYLLTILFILMFFTLEEISIIPEPVVYILKSQEVQFVERLDLFFIVIWMTWSVVTVTYLIFTVLLLFNKNDTKKRRKSAWFIHLFAFLLPLIIIWKDLFNFVYDFLIYSYPIVAFIIPFFIISINAWRSKRVEKT